MSGGHWGYSGALIRLSLQAISENAQVASRFRDLARCLSELAQWIEDTEHILDFDVSGDAHIPDDKSFEHRAFHDLLHAVLPHVPDAWFPRGKWATIQAVLERADGRVPGEEGLAMSQATQPDESSPKPPPPSTWMEGEELDPTLPYSWCIGAPTRDDCRRRGYCARDPNCGE